MEHFRGSLSLRSLFGLLVALLSLSSFVLANKDLYKILEVEKGASQRDIQKAFHRLSLKYHPDKNSAKSAEAKFTEINSAYEVLSDEEKRKNYDLYGDEQGPAVGPEGGGYNGGYNSAHSTGGHDSSQGWSYFTSDSNDNNRYRFEQHTHGFGGEEASYSQSGFFNFPFGSNPGRQEQSSTFGFGGSKNIFGNIFDSWFGSGSGGGQQFTSDRTGTENSRGKHRFEGRQSAQSSISADHLTSKDFKKKVLDQFYTWAILFSPDASIAFQENIQLLEQIAASMRGSIKAGYVKCDSQQSLCREQKMWPLKNSKLLVYSLRNNGKFSALEYSGEWSPKAVKQYCVEALPRFSKHIEKQDFGDEISHEETSPQAVLFTRKKETPAIWRALSGLFYGRVLFYDAQVNDGFDPTAKTLGVDSFPAVVGISANGKIHVLNSGSQLEQASSIEELKVLIEELEKISKSEGPRKDKSKVEGEILLLTKKSSKTICSQDTPLCIIAIFRSASGKVITKQILKVISQKTLVRRGQRVDAPKNPVSYCVLDATKQSTFLHAFDKSAFKRKDTVLIAYKPKKGTYASYDGPLNLENAESFVVEVLGGDLQLRQILQDPVLV